jgi:Flp pilus assembly protein TadD
MKEMIGAASVTDLEEIASICTSQAKPMCVEQALREVADKDRGNIEARARLAAFQSRMGELTAADRNYAQYFSAGGARPQSAYDYAMVLEKLNRIDDAARMFDFALVNKPDVLQITVTQAYVRMLMNVSRYEQARTLIDSIRKSGDNAKMFMEKEYAQLQKR